jgi:glucosamine 6-phosphate synthetase-like amidotransferase/phosphosugar isomerase protein
MTADPRRDIGIMREEIARLPGLIRTQIRDTSQAVEALLDGLDVTAIPRVVLTGCGDSFFVGVAARWAFERYARLPTESIEALDFARYYVDSLPAGTLVLPISYSGQVARTVEAARNAAHMGCTVVAITGRPERRLGQTVPRVLAVQIPSLGFSPGTTTYIGLLVAVYLLAIGLGRRRGLITGFQAGKLLEQLEAISIAVESTIVGGDEPYQALASWLAEAETVVFLGSGPNYASAMFGAAKLFEGAQMHGVAQNTEEWAHEQYFISDAATRTVLLAPIGRGLDRAREIAREMRFIETPFLVITDDQDAAAWQALTTRLVSLPSGVAEVFSPILFTAPLSLLGYYMAVARGKTSYNFPSDAHEREHYETLHTSVFRVLEAADR